MSKPIEMDYRDLMNGLAEGIDGILNGTQRPKPTGFALLVFRFGDARAGRMNWISNGQRADMLVALKEMVAQLEGRLMPSAHDGPVAGHMPDHLGTTDWEDADQ